MAATLVLNMSHDAPAYFTIISDEYPTMTIRIARQHLVCRIYGDFESSSRVLRDKFENGAYDDVFVSHENHTIGYYRTNGAYLF